MSDHAMVIAICAALAIFFDPIARPLAKGARWLWVRRPWGRAEREANARMVRRLNHEIHHVHNDACRWDCSIGGHS
jgi:hypothetical protein